jgi:hypothetical protein
MTHLINTSLQRRVGFKKLLTPFRKHLGVINRPAKAES